MAHLGTTAEAAGLKMELCHRKKSMAVTAKDMLVYQNKTNNRRLQTSADALTLPQRKYV